MVAGKTNLNASNECEHLERYLQSGNSKVEDCKRRHIVEGSAGVVVLRLRCRCPTIKLLWMTQGCLSYWGFGNAS